MTIIYMPNSGKPIEEHRKPRIPPEILAAGTGATAITGFTAYKFWGALMTYKWVILLFIIVVAVIGFISWKLWKGSKEDDAEDE